MTPVQEKIKKTSKTVSVILRIAEVFVIVGAILSAIGLVILLCNSPELSRLLQEAAKFPDAQVAAILMPVLMGLLVAAMAVDAVGCHQLYRIFKDISREGAPFSHKHVRRIKTIAWLTLPTSILSGTLPNVQWALESGERMMMVGIEVMWPVFGAILYCLALIFDYGCQLQQESDETL